MDRALPPTLPKVPHDVNAEKGFPGLSGPLAVKCTQGKTHGKTGVLHPDA